MASKPRKSLENWEIALIKAMITEEKWNDQDILAYFTRPTRSINHARISAIRSGTKHASVKVASTEELARFLVTWPDVDPATGLSVRGDELLLKAREAMIAAVHVFNALHPVDLGPTGPVEARSRRTKSQGRGTRGSGAVPADLYVLSVPAAPAGDGVNGSSRPRHRAPVARAPGLRRRSDVRRPEFAAPVPRNPLD